MNILLENNKELRGDLVLLAVVRTDLTTVPSTLELLLRADDDLIKLISEGRVLKVGEGKVAYRIVYSMFYADGESQSGDHSHKLIKVIALLDCCHKIAFVLEKKAVIEDSTTLGAVYRSCGAKVSVKTDIKLNKFVCYKGQVPSFSIQKSLQLAGAVIVWDLDNGVSFLRIRDLFKQKPKDILEIDNTRSLKSKFLERHFAPEAYSYNTAGSLTYGGKKNSATIFQTNCDLGELNNLGTYLLQSKQLTTAFNSEINAGDIIRIVDKDFVVITAVHAFSNPEGGNTQLSRFWLGELRSKQQ